MVAARWQNFAEEIAQASSVCVTKNSSRAVSRRHSYQHRCFSIGRGRLAEGYSSPPVGAWSAWLALTHLPKMAKLSAIHVTVYGLCTCCTLDVYMVVLPGYQHDLKGLAWCAQLPHVEGPCWFAERLSLSKTVHRHPLLSCLPIGLQLGQSQLSPYLLHVHPLLSSAVPSRVMMHHYLT